VKSVRNFKASRRRCTILQPFYNQIHLEHFSEQFALGCS